VRDQRWRLALEPPVVRVPTGAIWTQINASRRARGGRGRCARAMTRPRSTTTTGPMAMGPVSPGSPQVSATSYDLRIDASPRLARLFVYPNSLVSPASCKAGHEEWS